MLRYPASPRYQPSYNIAPCRVPFVCVAAPKYKDSALKKRFNILFLVTVALPTILAVVYYGLIASDIYISESRFVVRSQQGGGGPSLLLGSLLAGSGLSSGQQDESNVVHDFILSRDALKQLNQDLGLEKAFSSPKVDFLQRFSAIDWDSSFEGLYKYYPRRVAVETDTTSSVTVLQVNAFSAEQAKAINERLLTMSEALVNQLNDRARQDLIGFASADVRKAEVQAKAASQALADYRSRNTVVDPEKQSAAELQQIAKLQDSLVEANTQLSQLRALTPDNPQIPALRTRITSLEAAVKSETERIAGAGGSLTNKAATYQRLDLQREFADKQLGASLAALENAYTEAQRKQIYLNRVVQPNLPDKAMEPRRLRSVMVIFALGLVAWGVLSLLVASVKEHLD